NVVDADDLIREVYDAVVENTRERGELDSLSGEAYEETLWRIALGALKFFIVQVNPRKRMLYDPLKSVDLQGHTGPYVQNAYVRIKSLLRKLKEEHIHEHAQIELNKYERALLMELHETGDKIKQAAVEYDPSH